MTKLKGEKVKIKILATGTELVLGGQRGASLDMGASDLSGTSKDSDGWEETEAGLRNWSVSCDGLYVPSDTAFQYLLAKFVNGEKIDVAIESETNELFTFEGKAIITSFPIDAPYDDLVSYSLDLKGDGKPDFGDLEAAIATINAMAKESKAEVKK